MRSDVLFLCVANSARSQMAEGLAREVAPAGVGVHSAGSLPGTLNPYAVRALAEVGIDISHHFSKPIDAVPIDQIARVVTLCAAEVCPIFPHDVTQLHWPFPDPADARGEDAAVLARFGEIRDAIRARLCELFD